MADLAKPRVAQSPAPEPIAKGELSTTTGGKENIDVFIQNLDREIPFVADYYGVQNMLGYKELPYKEEIDAIDDYLVNEVKEKRLENTTKAVREKLKALEKAAGIKSFTPTAQRTKTLAAFLNYLRQAYDLPA